MKNEKNYLFIYEHFKLMLCVFQINVLADENAPMIIVESVTDSPGATVDVCCKSKK